MDNQAFVNRLKVIRSFNELNPCYVNKQLYRLVTSRPALIAGYETIKSNKGATTLLEDGISLDGFEEDRFNQLIKSLRDESWQPRPAKRVMIPKAGKSSLRPLGIQGPEENIVQSSLLIVLEKVYEPIFSQFSYGFRPNLNAHHALKDISLKYDNVPFAIEGDIKGMYDKVNHHTLMKLIKKKVDDSRLESLIWKLLRAGYMLEGEKHDTYVGTPQGSIVSPLLANIYLHELDVFMESLITIPQKRKHITTPQAKITRNEICNLLKLINNLPEGAERDKEIKRLKQLRIRSIYERTYSDAYMKVYYHRYAGDFIVGIAASKKYVEEVKEKIKIFLANLNLELSEDKTKISNLKKERALFLGYDIYLRTSKKVKKVHIKGKAPILKGTRATFVSMEIPMKRVITKLQIKSFCNNFGFPTPKRMWSVLSEHEIVNLYNRTLLGILNYFSGVSCRRHLRRIFYILKYSCAMTIAAKQRSSINKVFNRYGYKPMTVKYGIEGEKSIKFKEPNLFKESDAKWQVNKKPVDPFKTIDFKLTIV